MISADKSIVGYFKHSGHNKNLNHTLKQDVSTRWNSQYFMLQSLSNELNDVTTILENKKQKKNSVKVGALQNIDSQLLRDVIDFLHPFRAVTVQLSLETEPTFHRVWSTLHRLVSICSITLNDIA
jgi:hypothetical protein